MCDYKKNSDGNFVSKHQAGNSKPTIVNFSFKTKVECFWEPGHEYFPNIPVFKIDVRERIESDTNVLVTYARVAVIV